MPETENTAMVTIRDHNDETALSQLGAAAILLWSKVPQDLRAEMVELVAKIDGIRTSRDFDERLSRLIETNQH